jgi:hypothetical protein
MKRLIILILLATQFAVFAQEESEKAIVDSFIKRFNAKMDTVSWLCEYDNIAWWTSDSVAVSPKEEQARLGSEWFCFEQDRKWHAVYGKYASGRYDMVYHYEVDTNGTVKRVRTGVDTSLLNSFARALVNAGKLQAAYPDSSRVRFNQYIRRNSDGSLSVWRLPAFTTSGVAVYGGEFNYNFDKSGNNLLSKWEYSQQYRGFKPDKKQEIHLDYETMDEPTVGAVFFVWYYRKYFEKIVIRAKKFSSTVFRDDDQGYYWVHARKPD